MLTDVELKKLEQKYFDILCEAFEKNIAIMLNQCYSQNMQTHITTGTANPIEHAIENIVENVIAKEFTWPICSVPISSDSCYECGDAILYIDAKTIKNTDHDAISDKVNLQGNQTSYDSSRTITINSKTWNAAVNHYAQHNVFGEVPNLTYAIKFIYSVDATTNIHLIEKIELISIPNGQFYLTFNDIILGGGRSVDNAANSYRNIRFLVNEICAIENWRRKVIYLRR